MGAALYSLYAIGHLVLLALAIQQARRRFTWTLGVIIVLAATIAYDNAMLVVGNAIGEGDTLRLLSWPRFVIHAFVTPVGIAVVVDQARRLGVGWAAKPVWRNATWVLTVAMIAMGVNELLHIELVTDDSMNLLRYTAEDPAIPIPAIVTVIVMIAAGWSVKRTTRWATLFTLGIVTFVGSAAPPIDGMLVLGNFVEIVFVAALLLTEQRAARDLPPVATPDNALVPDAS